MTSSDVLNLMKDKDYRRLEIKDVLVYYKPNNEPEIFVSKLYANLTKKAQGIGTNLLDEIMIRDGFNKAQSLIDFGQTFDY